MLCETIKRVERRYSTRWITNKMISWRVHHGKRVRHSKLIERSLNSMVLLSSRCDVPPIGAYVHPDDEKSGDRHGFRLAIVRRIHERETGYVVFLEIFA